MKERLTATYVPSATIEMILTFQSPFELYCKIYPVKRVSINFHKFRQGRQRSKLRCDIMENRDVTVFVALLESFFFFFFEDTTQYTPSSYRN